MSETVESATGMFNAFAPYLLLTIAAVPSIALPQTAASLKEVQKVYVGSLGKNSSSGRLKKDLISELRRSDRLKVVSSPQDADAVITGAGELWVRGFYSLNPRSGIMPQNGTAVFGGSLSIELNGRDGDTLWSYLATPRTGSTDIGRDLCRQLVRQLTEALEHAAPDTVAH